MSSKTGGFIRLWVLVLLLGVMGVGFGCNGDDDDNNGGGAPADTTPPTFSGLATADDNDAGEVVLTAPEATDDQTPSAEMTYLIFVAPGPAAPIDTNGSTPYQFSGTQCAGGTCTFTITDLAKDGSTLYHFASRAQDRAGNRDGDAHTAEATLQVTPAAAGATPDTTRPTFGGLTDSQLNSAQDVVLTAPQATDDRTPAAEMTYLIFVSTTTPVDTAGDTPHQFPGTQCSNGTCTFTITGLAKDGTTYHFASRAQDKAGNRDQDTHPSETAGLSESPLAITPQAPPGGGNPASPDETVSAFSLNVDKTKDAVHPSISVVGDKRVIIWEECTPDPFDPEAPVPGPAPRAWERSHPCGTESASKVYMKQGANWDLVRDPALGGRDDLTKDPSRHAHDPAVITDGTDIYAAWEEVTSTDINTLFVQKFSGADFSTVTDTGFPDTVSFRPALTRHTVLGSDLGIAYEFSPTSNRQLFFRRLAGTTWSDRSPALNIASNRAAEAPSLSKKGNDLYVAWKEDTTPTGTLPNIFVKKLVGGNWEAVGGSLNIDKDHEARFPSIDVLPTTQTPYVAWHECLEVGCNNRHVFVKHLEGSVWVQDKDTSNCPDPNNCLGSLNSPGSPVAEPPSLAVHNNQVYVAWSERTNGNNRAIRIKKLVGNTWVPINLPANLFVKNAFSPVLTSDGALHIAWIEEDQNGVLQVLVAKLG